MRPSKASRNLRPGVSNAKLCDGLRKSTKSASLRTASEREIRRRQAKCAWPAAPLNLAEPRSTSAATAQSYVRKHAPGTSVNHAVIGAAYTTHCSNIAARVTPSCRGSLGADPSRFQVPEQE